MAGIYLHIPFCKQACYYCNFYFSVSKGNKAKFLNALQKEICLSKNYLAPDKISTLYIGGGTPSQLETQELIQIINTLNEAYDLSCLEEFTIEANPDDLGPERVSEFRHLRDYGVNRFSIGVQSFRDEDLRYMNRAHCAEEASAAVKRVQDAGFENITIDLIYGTPTMNNEQWLANLQQAFALQVPHISSYALTVEPKTTLAQRIKKGKCLPVDEAQTAEQFILLAAAMRKAGYEHYEISNFAKPGRYAIHNTNYWSGKKYLGLGPSAHSFNQTSRRWNVSNILNYIESIGKGQIPYREEILTPAQISNEKIMTALRTQWGLALSDIHPLHAAAVLSALRAISPSNYTYIDEVIRLTDEGKLFADAIAAQLFIDEP